MSAKSFNPRIETRGGHLWVTLPDSIDMDNYTAVEERVTLEIANAPTKAVVLDFCNTANVFSAGMGLIIRLNARAADKGKAIMLVNVSAKLREGFENVGLDRVFTIYSSAEELLAELS